MCGGLSKRAAFRSVLYEACPGGDTGPHGSGRLETSKTGVLPESLRKLLEPTKPTFDNGGNRAGRRLRLASGASLSLLSFFELHAEAPARGAMEPPARGACAGGSDGSHKRPGSSVILSLLFPFVSAVSLLLELGSMVEDAEGSSIKMEAPGNASSSGSVCAAEAGEVRSAFNVES